jgi:uncharacterized protein with von Willebrand factor type A (vWA) domain
MNNFTPEFNLKSVLNTDSFDRNMYKELREASKTLQETEKEGSHSYAAFPHLLGDTWAGLFKNLPEINPICPKGVEANQTIMEHVFQNPEFQALREYTKLDELASALGAYNLSDELSNIIRENKEASRKQEQGQKQQDMAEQAQNTAETLKKAAQMTQDPQRKKELLDQAKKELSKMRSAEKTALTLFQQAQKSLQEQLSGANSQKKLGEAIAKAGANAIEEKKEIDSLLTSMGYGTTPGQKQKVPAKDRLALAEALKSKPKLKDIANTLGRMQKIANKKQKERTEDSNARSDVDLGNELANILPSELALLKNPVTRKDFYKKFAQGELLQYSYKNKEKLGKGPIVCCIDTSGSMDCEDVYSKAFMLSILMIARKQKRAFACINYASASSIKSWVFVQSQRITPGEIVEMAEWFWNGGTDFECPLNEAIDVIKNYNKFKKADIILVTDGSSSVNDNWLERFNETRKKMGVNVISIQLGNNQYNEIVLKSFSDKTVNAKGFFDESVSNAAFTI